MKYFINGNEVNVGDKIFHVKEGSFGGLNSTTTIEGTLTKENIPYLIDLNVIEKKDDCTEKKVKEEILKELDKNIEILEEVSKLLEDLVK